MSVSVTLNGVNFSLPTVGDVSWGTVTTNYLVAVSTGTLQKSGGSFTLTAETDFGASYGLKSLYYKSRSSNVATAGQIRFATSDSISWRNTANNANLALTVNGSDQLTFNGVVIGASGIGTVSSVSVVGGSSKLSSSGSPITSTGTITMDVVEANLTLDNIGGTLSISKGGSGATTANAALNAFLPSQGGNSGKYLTTDGTNTSWATVSGTGTVTSVGLSGTSNQVTVTGSSPITTSGSWTLSLPQDIATSSNVQFGKIGLGSSVEASSILSLSSTSLGFLPPRMTTTQRDAISSPGNGLVIYNTTTGVLNFYNGSVWGAVGSGSGTVTSVAATSSGSLSISGSPITTSGTLTIDIANVGTAGSYAYVTTNAKGQVIAGYPVITTKGDIYVYSSGVDRLPVGTNGQVLTADSTTAYGLKWAAAGGTGTVTSVAATAPAAGFTISGSPITTTGTLTFALADDLAAVEGLSTTGIATRTASNTWTTRTITAGSSKISVTNGDGVSGNPTIDVNQANLNISAMSGTLGVPNGGTGSTTVIGAFNLLSPLNTKGDVLTFNGTDNVRLAVGTNGQVLSADSTTATGLKWIAGGGTVTSVNLTAPAAGITVSGGPITTSGSITLALANDLAAVEGLSTTGLAVRTGTSTWTTRTATAGSSKLSITDGDGVAANPTFDVVEANLTISNMAGTLAITHGGTGLTALGTADQVLGVNAAGTALEYKTNNGTTNRLTVTNAANSVTYDISASYVGQSSITTLGTITSGTWNGTTIAIANGGTGQTTANDALNALLPSQTTNSGKYLKTDGTNSSWASPSPLSVKGDIYTFSTVDARLPVGSNGQILVANSSQATGLQWVASFERNWVYCNGNVNFTTAPSAGTGSIAIGDAADNTSATSCIAIGSSSSTATGGSESIAIGVSAATGVLQRNIAIGKQASVTGGSAQFSIGIGYQASASGGYNIALGTATTSSDYSTAIGYLSSATATNATSIGRLVTNSTADSFRAGYSTTNILHLKNSGNLTLEGSAAQFVAPSYTTAGLPTGTTGGIVFDTTTVTPKFYNGSAWTGFGTGTVTSIDLTAPAAGITVSGGPITSSGSITLALADDLAAVEGLSTSGVAVRTGTSTWTTRTITGTSNQVTVTNGDGVAGAPTLSLPQDIATSSTVQFGKMGIGAASETASILSLSSTTLGFLPPRMTTTQRDAISTPSAGLLIYNTTTSALNMYTSSWTAVGGGTSYNWLRANNNVDFTTAPTGSGSNSIILGNAAVSSTATNAIAIGTSATASGNSSVVIGNAATASTYTSCTTIGPSATCNGGNLATAIGTGCIASAASTLAVGRDALARNTAGVGIGYTADAAGTRSIAIGENTIAGQNGGNTHGLAVLSSSSATGYYSAAFMGATVTHDGSINYGNLSNASRWNNGFFFMGGRFNSSGDAQLVPFTSQLVKTTDATQTTLNSYGGSSTLTAVTSGIPIATSACVSFDVIVTAKSTTTAGDVAMFKIQCVAHNNAGTVTVNGLTTTTVYQSAGLSTTAVTMDASSTNVRIRVTGVAATNISWLADIRASHII